jgi:hypothetical protein
MAPIKERLIKAWGADVFFHHVGGLQVRGFNKEADLLLHGDDPLIAESLIKMTPAHRVETDEDAD